MIHNLCSGKKADEQKKAVNFFRMDRGPIDRDDDLLICYLTFLSGGRPLRSLRIFPTTVQEGAVINFTYKMPWARPQELKIEAGTSERGGVLGMFPSPSARGSGDRCKVPTEVWYFAHRPGDLERFIGLESRAWCRFC